jgi:DNA ligase (NAD+)
MLTHTEYLQLITEVNRLRNEVHLFNNEEISEAALDDLKHKISQFEAQNPDKISPNSPNYTIAGGISSGFEKFSHTRRMLSLTDVFSYEELQDWENRWVDYAQKQGVEIGLVGGKILKQVQDDKSGVQDDIKVGIQDDNSQTLNGETGFNYICEPKLDGMAISLHYENGELVAAATRGDGFTGELVTENVKQIKNIPKKIEYLGKIEVRGEIFMTKKDFADLNKAIAAGEKVGKMGGKGETATFANSRNAAAGTIRQLDSRIVAQRNLSFVAYNLYVEETKE